MKKIMGVLVIALALVMSPYAALAAEKEKQEVLDEPWERFAVRFGGYLTALNSDVGFGIRNLGLGITIDVEDTLGLDSSTAFVGGEFLYRFGSTRRHRVEVMGTAFRRDSTEVLLRDVTIDGTTVVAGTPVTTRFDFDMIRAGYVYSFFKDDRINLGVGGGLYVMPIEFEFSTPAASVVNEDFVAPLPVLKLSGEFAITPKWLLRAGLDLFYLEIGDFTGSIVSPNVAVEYNAWEHVGFGLSGNFFNARIESEDADSWPGVDFVGEMNFETAGVVLYMKLFW